MKTLLKITIFTLILILALGIKGAKAHDEYSKVIRKEYPLPADGQLTISNKFGKIHFNNWEKNAVSFEITVTAAAPDKNSAEKMLDLVDFVFNSYPTTLEAKTRFGEHVNQGKSSIRVDYMVNIPAGISLNVINKFGDVFLNEVSGKTRLEVAYGNLEANKLGNSDNFIDLSFGKANLSWSKGVVLMLKYSQMDLLYSGSLYLDSKFSDVDAGEIISATINSEGGNISLEKSALLKSKSRFTTLDIGRIEKSMNLDMQYGACEVHEVPADFTSIVISNQYGDIEIGITDAATYQIEAELKFCEIDYPEKKSKFSFRSSSPVEKTLKGYIGSDNPNSKVQVKSQYGSISLK
jgi:hypothetical protein